MNSPLDHSAPDIGDRLVQFEAAWSSGQVPDVARYFRDASDEDRQLIEDLIEIDLECRWKQFDAECDPSAKDRYGFPRFPLVDDYASLLQESLQQLIFTPHCVAEEYRVRSRWGDKPNKESVLERFASDRTAIEDALHQIDTEFKNEGIQVSEESSLSHAAPAQPTVILEQSTRKDSSLVPEAELIGTIIGKYQLESRLGHGAFGEVWKAHDPDLIRDVAIKFPRLDKHFPAEILETFRTEAQKVAALDHIPYGIVPVYERGEHEGRPYFVSKLIDGESLADRMQREKLSHEESARLIAKVAETLKRAHKEKLVHRDIKPANILLNQEGEPYIADFGMAATDDERLSERSGILGTIAYMAPEQARGESHRVDGRADIYALGVILYRLLTNELPYGGKDSAQYLDSIQHQKPRPPRQIDETIPAELERICLKCLEKNEADRYSTASDLSASLLGCLSPSYSRRQFVTIIAGGSTIVASSLLAADYFLGNGNTESETDPQESQSNQVRVQNYSARPVTLETTPAGAHLVFHPIDDKTGLPQPEKKIVAEGVKPELMLKPGDYLVVAYLDDGRFHEVYRRVPNPDRTGLILLYNHTFSRIENGQVILPSIIIHETTKIRTTDMSHIPGNKRFLYPPYYSTEQNRFFSIPDFYVDQYEYTQGRLHDAAGNERGKERFIEQGPDYPLRGKYTLDQFIHYAEREGKRLLTAMEYYFIASNGGTTRFPWGDEIHPAARNASPLISPVGEPPWDHTRHDTPVFGLCSGVAEWTSSRPLRVVDGEVQPIFAHEKDHFVVKGGSEKVVQGNLLVTEEDRDPRQILASNRTSKLAGVGCRFALSSQPRIEPEDFVIELE